MASGGRGANHASGVTSSDRGGTTAGIGVADCTGEEVETGAVWGRLQEEIPNIKMSQIGWIFMAHTFLIND